MFALLASSSDCQAGYYCKTASTLRSPVAVYATDYVDPDDASGPETTPIAGVTNWWEVADVADPNGDVCARGNYCNAGVSQMTACTAGYYCPDDFMKASDTSLECREGFYC